MNSHTPKRKKPKNEVQEEFAIRANSQRHKKKDKLHETISTYTKPQREPPQRQIRRG